MTVSDDPFDRDELRQIDQEIQEDDVKRAVRVEPLKPTRLLGSGLELASYTLILGGLGYWIDSIRDHVPPFLGIAGVLVGFVLGMYRLIRISTLDS